ASAIKMRFDGVRNVSITPNGDLVLKIGGGEIRQPEPEIYQVINGARRVIPGGYKILDSRTVGFAIAGYDHSAPLVIDPVLGYSTFFGGNVGDTARVTALDASGDIYIAGDTFSKFFSTTGAVQTNYAGGQNYGDAFVAKLDPTGTNLIYLTYLGGSGDDVALGLAVDSAGNAFIGGYTDSKNFPTNNALYPTIPSVYSSYYGFQPGSGFVSELNAAGTQLIYSTYLGGASANMVEAIAVDSADNAYAVGYTYSTNFPVTANALLPHLASTNGTAFLNPNAFLTEIASNDSKLVYSTYLGGTNYDVATGVAVDASDNVYVAGYTASFNFPTWNTPANLPDGRYLNGLTNQTSVFFRFDAFATKFPPLNGTIPPSSQTNFYSTFLGGTNNDMAYGIAADAAGDAYVTGWTASTNFPLINSPPGLS
ncbi:MAG: SBBP repeat-containing protein, partial [Limisphaerales bacterium]